MNLSASSAKPGDPTYFLEGIIHDKSEMADFEGPLSLILLLLSKNKIEIRDIKISDILDQYLEYLNAMEKLDLEIASEFVQMASYLLYIKTRMLLTEEKEVTELEQLIASLEQLKCKDTYAAVKTVTPMLEAAAQTGLHYLSRPPEPLPKAAGDLLGMCGFAEGGGGVPLPHRGDRSSARAAVRVHARRHGVDGSAANGSAQAHHLQCAR